MLEVFRNLESTVPSDDILDLIKKFPGKDADAFYDVFEELFFEKVDPNDLNSALRLKEGADDKLKDFLEAMDDENLAKVLGRVDGSGLKAWEFMLDLDVPEIVRGNPNNIKNIAIYLEKESKFTKQQNALLVYDKADGTHFMTKASSFPDLNTGLANQRTFSFRFKSGPNAGSKDVYAKIGLTDEGYLVGNIIKTTGMDNAGVTKVTEDAMDMALKEFGGIGNVKGIKAQWVENPQLYPDLPDNKSINLIMFEDALKTLPELKAVFETVTGAYAKIRLFTKVKEIKRLTLAADGVNGYEVIFELPK